MTKDEIDILIKFANNKYAFKQLIDSRMATAYPYFGYLMDSLLKRGYLNGSRVNGYQLTAKSNRAIKEHLKENERNNNKVFLNLRRNHKSRVKKTIQRIDALGAMCDSKMENIQISKLN